MGNFVSPASAGMSRAASLAAHDVTGKPRVSGDEPVGTANGSKGQR